MYTHEVARSGTWTVCVTLLLTCACQGGSASAGPQDAGAADFAPSAQPTGGSAADAHTADAPLAGTAIALISPFGDGTVTGTATFLQNAQEVSLVVALNHCPDGPHGVHIHEGTSCTDIKSQGGHWDNTRGEGIPDVMCADDRGASMVKRAVDDPLAWSIGGPAMTNLVGHVFVVHAADDPATRIGCGPITVR